MKQIHISQIFSLIFSCAVLLAPLQLSAIAQGKDETYIYLSDDLSNISRVIRSIKNLDDHKNSPLAELHQHIEDGFFLEDYNTVIESLKYAEDVLQRNYNRLDDNQATQLWNDFEVLANQVLRGELSIDSEFLDNIATSLVPDNDTITTRSYRCPRTLVDNENNDCEASTNNILPQELSVENDEMVAHLKSCPSKECSRTLIINEQMDVLCKTIFRKHLRTKQGLTVDGKLKVGKKATFKDDVCIEGTLSVGDAIIDSLSVTDLVVLSCMDSLCVNTLSVSDLIISSCIDSLCVNNLSAVDASISGTLSVNDATINSLSTTDLVVLSCMDSLCVNNLSAIDASISGTLSVNNATINSLSITDLVVLSCMDNLCVNNLSVTDLIVSSCMDSLCVNNLSVTDLIVSSCMDSLCVNNLSAVDVSISGTLSANNAVINSLSVTDLVVLSCMDSLCVDTLSVTDIIVPGGGCLGDLCVDTLSVTDLVTQSLTIPTLSPAGVVHNNAAGLLSSSLIVNADVSPIAGIVDTKLATISTAGKVLNSATTATTAATANAIVSRDALGRYNKETLFFTSQGDFVNGEWISQQGATGMFFDSIALVASDCWITNIFANCFATPTGGSFTFDIEVDGVSIGFSTTIVDGQFASNNSGNFFVAAGQSISVKVFTNVGATRVNASVTLLSNL